MDRLTHNVHQDLLAQVASSEHEAREVRRILGALTEEDLDAAQRWRDAPAYPHCISGPCNQGRKLCPCPAACQRGTPDYGKRMFTGATALAAFLFVVALVVTALIASGVRL